MRVNSCNKLCVDNSTNEAIAGDFFLVILHNDAVDKFFTHLNQIESAIKLTMEGERDSRISCSDILITRDVTETLDTNIYRKPTHSECLSKFQIRTPFRTVLPKLGVAARNKFQGSQGVYKFYSEVFRIPCYCCIFHTFKTGAIAQTSFLTQL